MVINKDPSPRNAVLAVPAEKRATTTYKANLDDAAAGKAVVIAGAHLREEGVRASEKSEIEERTREEYLIEVVGQHLMQNWDDECRCTMALLRRQWNC